MVDELRWFIRGFAAACFVCVLIVRIVFRRELDAFFRSAQQMTRVEWTIVWLLSMGAVLLTVVAVDMILMGSGVN